MKKMTDAEIKKAIEYDFPIKIAEVVGSEVIDGGIAGLIVTDQAVLYNFSIEEGDRPWLQRYVPDEE